MAVTITTNPGGSHPDFQEPDLVGSVTTSEFLVLYVCRCLPPFCLAVIHGLERTR